ncbi:HNH endonuclease signature motif containing protein [Microbacterium pumilum]|uniref:HNH nuclease domain-containing protein n=1 Tax=Microbacterium pumilum TaxID=344165 RepID=A0ABP5D8D3_9MICO
MNTLAAALEAVDAALAGVVEEMFAADDAQGVSDDELLAVLGLSARIARRAEAVQIESVAQIYYRSSVPARDERMTSRYGCRSTNELVQRVTRASSRSAAELVKAGHVIIREVAPSSGETLPAEYPAMRAVLASGHVGLDGLLAVVGPLAGVAGVAGRAAHQAADEELAAAARGEGVDAAPPACADDLRALASVWATYLDQDGAEPREAVAMRKRGLAVGVCRDGLVPVRGNLLPEVAGQLKLVFDSILNPKVDGSSSGPEFRQTGPEGAPVDSLADDRTRAQKQHDAFATAIFKVAGSGALPTLGGAAPTLVVSVRAADLQSGRGFAHIDGFDEPVSLSLARQVACCGNVERVISDKRGRIVAIETSDRIFNYHQRLGIALRDGECIIPGCHVPASWCEIHHVREHSRGGSTGTDNGVPLCWHHHRTLDCSGWQIRMNHGVPDVRGPTWWDGSGTWRAVTMSPTRLRERLGERTTGT